MNSILITGCNRGLGLGLVKALLNLPQPPQHLFTTCRNREQAKVRDVFFLFCVVSLLRQSSNPTKPVTHNRRATETTEATRTIHKSHYYYKPLFNRPNGHA